MTIVTLTTDYGTSDHYVAMLKGRMLSHCRHLNLVDVSHEIERFDTVQAAFVLRHAYPSFPEGTIHVVIVHNRPEEQGVLLLRSSGHYFLLPDNGIATLLLESIDESYLISTGDEKSWKETVARAVGKLAAGEEPSTFAAPYTDFVERIHLMPVVTSEYIRGMAIHIDHYDNVVFNIKKDLFESVCAGRDFELYYKRHDPVTVIHRKFYDVPVGEVLCRFNDLGFLELGINMGRAASLLGIKVDDLVHISFTDNGEERDRG